MSGAPSLVRRAIVLTPLMGGADGISEMTRQWVRILESRVGQDVDAVEIWSLDDDRRPADIAPATRFVSAHGARVRFASLGLRNAIGNAADTLIIVMHAQLLPIVLPLHWRGARLLAILMGIEAWVPLRPLQRAVLRRAWKVTAISTHTVTRFRAANPLLADVPITVCPPGVPDLRPPRDARMARDYALIVGRMNPRERYKGHDLLIDVWPLVRRAIPDARLIIAGDGDDADRLRARAGEGIEFVGRVDQATLAALYRDAAFFVMPSTDEGFGLVYLEAMRASTPCIAARGAAEEIITNGRDGVIIDAGDRDGLVAAMIQLFVDGKTRARMGAAAAEHVDREFGPVALERRVCSVLELGASQC